MCSLRALRNAGLLATLALSQLIAPAVENPRSGTITKLNKPYAVQPRRRQFDKSIGGRACGEYFTMYRIAKEAPTESPIVYFFYRDHEKTLLHNPPINQKEINIGINSKARGVTVTLTGQQGPSDPFLSHFLITFPTQTEYQQSLPCLPDVKSGIAAP